MNNEEADTKSRSLVWDWCAGVGIITIGCLGFQFITESERIVVLEDGELKYVRSLGFGLHRETYDLEFREEKWQIRWRYRETPFGVQDKPKGDWRELPSSEVWLGN